MSKITNLRAVRKQKAREEKRSKATVAAAHSGESKAARVLRAAQEEQRLRKIDQHQITEE